MPGTYHKGAINAHHMLHYTVPSCYSHMYSKSTQTVQTSANDKISTKSDPGSHPDFQINPDTDPDVCQICPKWCGCVILSSRSCHQVRYKSAVDCVINANKCPKIPHSEMVN